MSHHAVTQTVSSIGILGIRTRTSSKGMYLRKLFPKIGLGLGFGDLSSETISEDTYLCWMSECELRYFVLCEIWYLTDKKGIALTVDNLRNGLETQTKALMTSCMIITCFTSEPTCNRDFFSFVIPKTKGETKIALSVALFGIWRLNLIPPLDLNVDLEVAYRLIESW